MIKFMKQTFLCSLFVMIAVFTSIYFGFEPDRDDPYTEFYVFLAVIILSLVVAAVFIFSTWRSLRKLSYENLDSAVLHTSTVDLKKSISMESLRDLLKSQGYGIHIFRREENFLVAEDHMSLASWGFYYPIRLIGENQIRIEIVSKFAQNQTWNPVTNGKYQKILDVITSA